MTSAAEIARAVATHWTLVAGQPWLSIARVNQAVDIGLNEAGEWQIHVRRPDGSEELDAPSSTAAAAMLPLIEMSPEAFVASLSERAAELAVDPGPLIAVFPSKAVVEAALRTRSDYWVSLAAAWLDAEMVPVDSLVVELAAAADDLKVSQNLRHRLRRFARLGVG